MKSKTVNGMYIAQHHTRRLLRTNQDIEKTLTKMELLLMEGTLVNETEMTYRKYLIERYLKYNMTKGKRENLETHTLLCEKYIIPYIGHFNISILTHKRIQQFYKHLIKNQTPIQVIKKIHNLINDSLKTAVRWGMIPKNPSALVERPSTRGDNVLNSNQIEAFLISVKELHQYCIFYNITLISGKQKRKNHK